MPRRDTATPTRDTIATAATRLFIERGYSRTSVRGIAAAADVDPALVIRHFGTKEQLFLETMRLDQQPLLEGPIETLGPRFVDYVLTADNRTRGVYLALIRASDASTVGSRLREAHERAFVRPLAERLTGHDAELRARLAAALVGGLLYSLWIVGDDVLAAADHGEVVARYGGLLQDLLTPGS
ncbi:TetR/AcrR family transcriptional regulator [Actinorugispora endophytica]|uniref:TetR family transcriptional regulator n=1 Tax=Actinorugispora endophytica TaxID=1605990 RepID=A0A4R6V645_9ACTN|nr:TetR/AcrR family transcriptional regulator [Actinorugispora endophytica]TDQ54358.1 TetR family transcriptional regulator [Actinorugispora endophytica]